MTKIDINHVSQVWNLIHTRILLPCLLQMCENFSLRREEKDEWETPVMMLKSKSQQQKYQVFLSKLLYLPSTNFLWGGNQTMKEIHSLFFRTCRKKTKQASYLSPKNQMYLNKWLNVFGNQTMDEIYNGTRLNKHNIWPNSLMYLS